MVDTNEIEVDAAHILKDKQLKLRTIDGNILMFFMDVYESEAPYVMICIIKTAQGHSVRMDIQKDDLARELRLWLEGKIIRNASVIASPRIEGIMHQFIKFGKTPKQEDLIMWILSRSELSWGNYPSITFGGAVRTGEDAFNEHNLTNQYPKTTEAANRSMQNRNQNGSNIISSNGINDIFTSTMKTENISTRKYSTNMSQNSQNLGPSSSISPKRLSRSVEYSNSDDMGTYELTRRLLGKSVALSELSKSKIKGRPGAKGGSGSGIGSGSGSGSISSWGPEHFTLGT